MAPSTSATRHTAARATGVAPVNDSVGRIIGALGIVGIALVHLLDASGTYYTTRYIFWLYVVLIVTAVPMVILLLRWRSPLVWAGAAALATAPFAGYLVSRSVGLPGDAGDIGNWLNTRGMTSLFVEATVICLSLARLTTSNRMTSSRPDTPGAGPRDGVPGGYRLSLRKVSR